MEQPYNPLDRTNLGKSVVDALLERDVSPLSNAVSFPGSGVYAIYYNGKFKPYAPLAKVNREQAWTHPIYVGKAVPAGGRKGIQDASLTDTKLSERLIEHKESVALAQNLELESFYFRHIVVEDIWIPLGESLLIQQYQPLWNVVVEGFGNHDPGAGRYNGKRPVWDELHPGRAWAARCAPPKWSLQEILEKVAVYMQRLET